jgi:hypothetical protein
MLRKVKSLCPWLGSGIPSGFAQIPGGHLLVRFARRRNLRKWCEKSFIVILRLLRFRTPYFVSLARYGCFRNGLTQLLFLITIGNLQIDRTGLGYGGLTFVVSPGRMRQDSRSHGRAVLEHKILWPSSRPQIEIRERRGSLREISQQSVSGKGVTSLRG